MPEWLDQALVAAAVSAALAYLLWRGRAHKGASCDAGGCGCGVGGDREAAAAQPRGVRPAMKDASS